jgi:hypothetical protein
MAKPSIFRRVLRVFRIVFAISFLTCLLVSLGFTIHTTAFIHSALRATGIVQRLDQRFDDQDISPQYAPVFKFLADDGQSYTVASATATGPPSFVAGQKVEVLYRKGNPGGAVINSFWELWLVSMVLMFIGLAHGFISGVCLLIERKLERSAQSGLIQHALRG